MNLDEEEPPSLVDVNVTEPVFAVQDEEVLLKVPITIVTGDLQKSCHILAIANLKNRISWSRKDYPHELCIESSTWEEDCGCSQW